MRTFLRTREIAVVLSAEEWSAHPRCASWDGDAFRAVRSGGALVLRHLGRHDVVSAVPINVTSRHADPAIRLIGNFAATPFDFLGHRYASVEGFWQSLRATTPDDRARIGALSGSAAKRAAADFETPSVARLGDREAPWGSPAHWDMMREACRAKFQQVEAARAALLATAPRPLIHRMRTDSRSIPGVVMASIWMGLRAEFEFAGRVGSRRQSP